MDGPIIEIACIYKTLSMTAKCWLPICSSILYHQYVLSSILVSVYKCIMDGFQDISYNAV